MTIQQKLTTGITTTGLLLSTFIPATFADFAISGNGSRSDNRMSGDFEFVTSLQQSNDFDVDNDINVSNSTGENRASGNTGGSVEIETGDASADILIHNMGNSNVASIESCGCWSLSDWDAKIHGNGSRSDSEIDLTVEKELNVDQSNDFDADNDVDVNNTTGDNRADDNTGSSDFWNHDGNNHNGGWNSNDWEKLKAFKKHHDEWGTHSFNKHMDEWDQDDWVKSHEDFLKKFFHNNDNNGGGDVSVETGDAEANVEVHNMGNHNVLDVK